MSILPLFVRVTAVIFATLMVLLGGVMLASGAFRPVRFFLIRPNDLSVPPSVAIFETGEVYSLAPNWEQFLNTQTGPDIISWINQRDELIYWRNGRQVTLGRSFAGGNYYSRWSSDGQIAWVYPQPNLQYTKDIWVWDGAEITFIPRNASEITWPTWVSRQQLWWYELETGSIEWQIMQWDGSETKVLFENIPPTEPAEIISCGAIWFTQKSPLDPLRLWHNTMMEIGIDSKYPITDVKSSDCQTFLLKNQFEHFIWDGRELHYFPFEDVVPLNNMNSYFGVEHLVNGDWALHVWRDGQDLQSTPVPQSRFLNMPNFTAYILDSQTLIISISRAPRIGDMYRWDLTNNELTSITGDYSARDVFGGLGLRVFGPETDRRVAWCGGLPGESTSTIFQWEARTNAITPIQANAQCILRPMSDGSLLGMMSSQQDMPEMFFVWDGQTMHYFPKNYEFQGSNSFTIASDWIYWE